MIKVKVEKGKKKTVTVNPTDLMTQQLHEVISEKLKKDIPATAILSFDGKKATYTDGETIELNVPEGDLVSQSITQWVQKHLKTKAQLQITVSTSGK